MSNIKLKCLVLVGIPGSGKSTFCKKIIETENFIIESSDNIRELYNLWGPENNKEVFKLLYEKTLKDLKNDCNVIYDATNINFKDRYRFLELIKDINCEKIAVVFNTPIEECKRRNDNRSGYAKVPEHVIDRMYNNFNQPSLDEGFDQILNVG